MLPSLVYFVLRRLLHALVKGARMRIRLLTAHLYHRELVLAPILFLILRWFLRLGSCGDPQAVAIENAVLRHQLARPIYRRRDRLFLTAASRLLPRERWSAFLVRPQTLLQWHRALVRRKWTPEEQPRPAADRSGASRRGPAPRQGESAVGLPSDPG